jgi:ParB-like chromosome segregation protein Spo0J
VTTRHIALAMIFREFTNGDETTWAEERAWLLANHPRRLARIRSEIQSGHLPPIRVDFNERRVIDGHHRLIAAEQLDLELVPIADAYDGSAWTNYANTPGDDDPAPERTTQP